MLDDVAQESRPQRARAFRDHVTIEELPLSTLDDVNHWHEQATAAAKRALDRGDFLFWIGGNHLSVMPLYEELGRRARSLVVQADAHLDVYPPDDVIRALPNEIFVRFLDAAPAIVNVGPRPLFLPLKQIKKHFAAAHAMTDFVVNA